MQFVVDGGVMANELVPVIDISRYEIVTNWSALRLRGVEAVITRATVGDYYTDPTYYPYMRDGSYAGYKMGDYHVLKPLIPITKQLEKYYSAVENPILNGLVPTIIPWLDVEIYQDNLGNTIDRNLITDAAAGMLAAWEKHFGCVPGWYSRKSFVDEHINLARHPQLKNYPFWVANYTSADHPNMPVDMANWVLWQHSEDGKFVGITGGVDINRLGVNGLKAILRKQDTGTIEPVTHDEEHRRLRIAHPELFPEIM
jgi:lysozyme